MDIRSLYEEAELEIICFDSEDVITTSLGGAGEGGYEEEFEEE